MVYHQLHLESYCRSLRFSIRQLIVGLILVSVAGRYDMAAGATIQYSWMGNLVPVNAGNDPWALGPMGKVYQLTVGVTVDATDVFPAEIRFAGYDTSNVKMVLAGSEVQFLGAGVLDFIDNEGLLDIIGFSGQFEQSGASFEITANAALPADTFEFSELIERPPFFLSRETVTNSVSSATGPYSGLTSVGTPVVVVPEPGAHFMGIMLLAWEYKGGRNRIRFVS